VDPGCDKRESERSAEISSEQRVASSEQRTASSEQRAANSEQRRTNDQLRRTLQVPCNSSFVVRNP
jgi:hypothetical protein